MKNKYAVFTVLILLCFCITACGNPIMEKWWDEHSGEERAVPPKSTVFHLVEFRPDGGLPAPGPQYIAHGGKLAKILPMSKDHYAFGGWYTDTAFSPGKEFDLTTDTVKNNLILYAKWVPVYNFKVTFVANGGSPPPPPQSLYTGTKAIEPPPMIRIGYGFGGWYTNPTFTTEYNFNANVTQDLTLYAKWQKLETSYYTVIFDPDGGFPPPVDQRVIADGTGKLVEPMAMTKAGYGFAGWWYMDVGLEYQWNFISSNLVDKDYELYAKWDTVYYTVTFDAKDGFPEPPDQLVAYDTLVNRPAAMAKPGECFGGWFRDDAYNNEWDFASDEVTGNISLYAKWERLPQIFTVEFDSDGGNPIPEPQTIVENTKIIEPPAMRKATGPGLDIWYGFGGWFTDPNFAAGSEWNFATPVTENLTENGILKLYAKWMPAPHCIVTFESNGGDPVPRTQDLIQESRVIEPLTMSKPGYGFAGWFTDPNFTSGSEWNFNTRVGSSNFTLYARWITNYYSVTFAANGGAPAPSSQRVAHGSLLTRPAVMRKSGAGFLGWYTAQDIEWNFSEDKVEREGIVLNAKWGDAHYIVKFDLKLPPEFTIPDPPPTGGHSNVPPNQEITLGGKITEPSVGIAFWSLYGWFYTDNPSFNPINEAHRNALIPWDFDKLVEETDFDNNNELTLYARWVPHEPDMVWVKKGGFMMGATGSGTSPVRNVKLTTGYYMAKYLVTQEGYKAVTTAAGLIGTVPGGNEPSQFKAEQPTRPVDRVSWYDAVAYCNWRTMQEDPTGIVLIPVYSLNGVTNPSLWGARPTSSPSNWDNMEIDNEANGYRLPTEAEWEYAARGGNGSPGNFTYSGSNNADDVAWFNTNSGSMTHPVGTKAPNGLGIYDLSGNVTEWCWDWFGSQYYSTASYPDNLIDPKGPEYGTERVRRGGNWNNAVNNVRNVIRNSFPPDNATWVMGFRVVRGPEEIY